MVIGADVIVGFPGEADTDFNKTVEVVSSGLIDYLHVFSYSDRPGTDASMMPGKNHSRVIKDRNEVLRKISDENYRLALQKEVGSTVGAISEHRLEGGSHYYGITDNYLKAAIPKEKGGGKEIIRLRINRIVDDHLIGTVQD